MKFRGLNIQTELDQSQRERIGNSNGLGRGRRGAPRGVRGPSLRVGEWAVLDSVQADTSRRTRAEHARRRALHRGDEVPRLPASGRTRS